ncbi:Bro-N domain-containing protein [Pseudomonas sp. P2757]|uniref:BRO-N domain-containing protein n=1 Tax=unclassified Pseudomonas TaxID=196821 RepID=UPI003B5B5D01
MLTGHPEHEQLFVATQVARAVGLLNPSIAVRDYRKTRMGADAGRTLLSVMGNLPIKDIPKDPAGRRLKGVTTLFTESEVNRMLMRGSTEKAYEFQEWLADEVVPTIRKTGKYDAEQSTNPIAQGVMDELRRF